MNSNIDWEEKTRVMDSFFEKVEKREAAKSSDVALMKLVSDTDKFPRIVWDRDSRIIYANKSFLDKTGYTFEQIKDKKFFNDDGTSDFITDDTLEESKKVTFENAANGDEMITGVINKWKAPKDGMEEITIDWHRGFNDTKSQLGSMQCTIVTWNDKGNALCTRCRSQLNEKSTK